MSTRRIIVSLVMLFLVFLGIYTWNQRTGKLDTLSANLGLEVTGGVLRVANSFMTSVSDVWDNYIYLTIVKQENVVLKAEIDRLNQQINRTNENTSELKRLRTLIALEPTPTWASIGVRILAWRVGSNDFFDSVMLSKGYSNGAKSGTPVVSPRGLVGRILKSGPYTSIALLITDPSSSVAVLTSKGRVSGILQGDGNKSTLVMRYVKQNAQIEVGETLVTSGLDLIYPKGIPVARVLSVALGTNSMLDVVAEPMIFGENVEEVLLLQNPRQKILSEGHSLYSPRSLDTFNPTQMQRIIEPTVIDDSIPYEITSPTGNNDIPTGAFND